MTTAIAATASGSGLAPALTILRLSLHVAAAAVWVGGQFVLAGLVPTARRIGPDAPRSLARAFARLSWPAYGVLVATGLWNVSTSHVGSQTTAWQVVLGVKIGVVALAGVGAYAHGRSKGRRAIAVWGAVGALSSVAALVMGVALAG